MEDTPNVTEILVPLLSDKRVPLRAAALIGEVITADAKLADRGEGKTVRADLDAIMGMFEGYRGIREEATAAVGDFKGLGSESLLIHRLSEIRHRLNALY